VASENVELVRSISAAWERGDWSSTEWAHPEIEWQVTRDGPVPREGTGIAELAEAWREFLGAWEGYRTVPDEFRELDGERVLVLIHVSGRGKTSGVNLEQMQATGANLFHIRNGKVTKLIAYFDRANALADLGIEE
jgi:ketosteroid isomerase-like protein